MERISIIVPVYNASKYLRECLDSLVNQTAREIEIIAVDDNSTDNSLEILEEYQSRYPKIIRVIHNEKNLGAAASRNKAMKLATGEYIGFVDSDDRVSDNMYQSMYDALKETNSTIARSNRVIVYGNFDVSFLGRKANMDSQVIRPKEDISYLSREIPCVTNKLFDRNLIEGREFPEGLKWEDYPFSIPVLYRASSVVVVPEARYIYNMNLLGTTVTDTHKIPKVLDIFEGSDRIIKEITSEDRRPEVVQELNYVAISNCLQRTRDILYSGNIPLEKKKELLSLVSSLIKQKYGSWIDNPKYQEYKRQKKLYRLRMSIVEKLVTDRFDNLPTEEIEHRLQKAV